jgi:hypothetical protein
MLSVAQYLCLHRKELGERLDRALGLHLLCERESRIEQDHDADRQRHRHDAGDPRQAGSRYEQ